MPYNSSGGEQRDEHRTRDDVASRPRQPIPLLRAAAADGSCPPDRDGRTAGSAAVLLVTSLRSRRRDERGPLEPDLPAITVADEDLRGLGLDRDRRAPGPGEA